MKNTLTTSLRGMKKILYAFVVLIFFSITAYSQNVGINETGNPPNAAAGLDVDFAGKGLLIPRVALTSTSSFAPLASHVAGMLVYNTATINDVTPGFYYDNGTKWISGFPSGIAAGNMLYWNGTSWLLIPPGLPGQFLQYTSSNIPTWVGASFATLTTTVASAITGTTASSGGNITADGGSTILSRGVCWSTSVNPTIANSKTIDGSGIGVFTSNLTGLSPATTYYVRAYATNSSATTYGNQISFTTSAVLATLTTTAASGTTINSTNSGGNITFDGGSPVTARGVCWSTTTNPTIANSITSNGTGTGSFVSNITGLNPNTLYYVRAYATNGIGTAYGNQISFSTLQQPPTIVTTAATSITSVSASTGATLSNPAGGNNNFYGVAYSTVSGSPTPTKVQTGSYPSTWPLTYVTNLTGLAANTTYYIRGYVDGFWNGSSSTAYGNELSFTTAPPTIPSLTTTAIGTITYNSSTSGGIITSDGGASITARGVCWSTSTAPTTANSKTTDGSGIGSFASSLTGLAANTTYYVRAYATNSVGTAYGNELSFTTCGTPIYTIGQSVGGGVVFYVDCTGQHGLIAATVDQGTGVSWGCQGTTTGATGTAVYSGATNTTSILGACTTAGIAAKLCNTYSGGGFHDWYLPAKDELNLMYQNQAVIPSLLTGTYSYWSSTENGANNAYIQLMYNGTVTVAVKGYGTQMVVRAIRKF